MKYPEEDQAKALHAILTDRFASSSRTGVDVDGAGVHWRCTATRDDSSCRIACFDHRGPEYYTTFIRDSEDMATARTSDRNGTVNAVGDWLERATVRELHDRYPFVDARKRSLIFIRDQVTRAAPELINASELGHRGGDIYYLKFTDGDRSSAVSYYGKNLLPDACFAWDDCNLFEYQPNDNHQLAAVLKRWVSDHAPPSEMRLEFPELEIGTLADYYERGNPIEGEFIRSWDSIEDFYKEDWCRFSESVLVMIHAMRDAGYDRLLRAGQSLSSLGVSRSRRHGLRNGQPCIWFNFGESAMNVHAEFAGVSLTQHPLQFTTEVQQLLDSLVKLDVD